EDALGVELAGALKNILGIAAGICDGLGFGDNAKAALLTRGLVEIARLGVHLGGRFETFYGLAGGGAGVTTCYSPYGRNPGAGPPCYAPSGRTGGGGEGIGGGEPRARTLGARANAAGGGPTRRSAPRLSQERGVEMPTPAELYQVLFEGKSPRAAVTDLMERQ